MQNSSPIKKRILEYLDYKGVSKYQFYKDSGVTRSVLDKDTGISEDNIAKFIAYTDEVNLIWLLTGKGFMLNKDMKSSDDMLAIKLLAEFFKEFQHFSTDFRNYQDEVRTRIREIKKDISDIKKGTPVNL